jgi:uridine kinase
MMSDNNTKALLSEHFRAFPRLEIQDVFKFLYQSSFGCEHLVSSLDAATEYIAREYAEMRPARDEILPLDGEYSRVPLSYMDNGLTAKTLGKLFFLSAKKEENGLSDLENKLTVASELVREGLLPFAEKDFDEAVSEWKGLGYPAVRHSQSFRDNYAPSYRVISNKFVPFLPIFARIDKLLSEKKRLTVAIDGGSASGKSTLAQMLEQVYSCTVFHMDDFFLPLEKRTAERLNEVGGNIDHERFLSEVLTPLSNGEKINYKRFDCSTMSLGDGAEITPERLVIVEGAYSMHPSLVKHYDLSAFLDISPELQRERIGLRNSPEFAERFFNEWIPLENVYFEKTDIKERCDLIIKIL